jgi:hypothetical protein
MAAPTPTAFWEKATEEQLTQAEFFIKEFSQHADVQTRRLQEKYPGEDIEPRIMMALYKAAYTWKEGSSGFYCWFQRQIWHEMSVIRHRRKHRRVHGIVVLNCAEVGNAVDKRFVYS